MAGTLKVLCPLSLYDFFSRSCSCVASVHSAEEVRIEIVTKNEKGEEKIEECTKFRSGNFHFILSHFSNEWISATNGE